ncbi:NrfD/PsrC family molybdoenzyme membrane anchor subunit [Paractinoplanes lichenicola]|uniref:Polysulfide reductase NrfD n=1 Tax=Paractinoplanes lichenicola TaxID=2802976 RepID=A0ABS1VUV8_9ACTN|nr:NrfD/PsrC family molybdoenzyme membrane anchor subunit [Actinoplanes lichenicola]MBL7258269.1 polysulfide reductase NrfD [Actinoplanes lichenicola]
MVPRADFQSYYGRPIVRPPVWTHDIAIYLFTGGLAAGSSLLAAGAQATGDVVLRRTGRAVTLGALGASTFFLIKDLGRPDRFHHMLRVAKPTSPMSMGTWLLSFFGGAAGVAAAAELAPLLPARGVVKLLPPLGSAAGYGAAALAPGLATYTAVLFADTAVPSWNAVHPDLPFMFAGSALASGAGVGLIAAPGRPARRMAVAGAAIELAAGHRVETKYGLLSEPYHTGRPGKLLRAARALTIAGAVGAVVGRRSRVVSALAGASLLAGSLLTRFGVFEAGVESAKDPRYTVVPQRERLNARTSSPPAAPGPSPRTGKS